MEPVSPPAVRYLPAIDFLAWSSVNPAPRPSFPPSAVSPSPTEELGGRGNEDSIALQPDSRLKLAPSVAVVRGGSRRLFRRHRNLAKSRCCQQKKRQQSEGLHSLNMGGTTSLAQYSLFSLATAGHPLGYPGPEDVEIARCQHRLWSGSLGLGGWRRHLCRRVSSTVPPKAKVVFKRESGGRCKPRRQVASQRAAVCHPARVSRSESEKRRESSVLPPPKENRRSDALLTVVNSACARPASCAVHRDRADSAVWRSGHPALAFRCRLPGKAARLIRAGNWSHAPWSG